MVKHFGGKLSWWQVVHGDKAEGGEELLFLWHHPDEAPLSVVYI